MLAALRKEFLPDMVVIHRPLGERPEICHLIEYTLDLTSKEGRATAYVCQNFKCNLPVTETGEMIELLRSK
jgi:uncharacterized protein YyaL (SSP411 family)